MSTMNLEKEPALPHRLRLPDAPKSELGAVKAWQEPVRMFSFLPAKPDPNPMF